MDNHGYKKEVCDDGVVIYRILSTTRSTVDSWYQDVAGEFAVAFKEGKPTRFVYDMRQVSMTNSYVMKRASDLAKLPLPTDWKVATLVGSTFIKHFINSIRTISLTSQAMYERSQIFTAEAEALAWLRGK